MKSDFCFYQRTLSSWQFAQWVFPLAPKSNLRQLNSSCRWQKNPTLTSSPSRTSWPCGGSNLAVVPGSSFEKIDPKSLLTWIQNQDSIQRKQLLLDVVNLVPGSPQSLLLLLVELLDHQGDLLLILFHNLLLFHKVGALFFSLRFK